jgi:hypothetical protein
MPRWPPGDGVTSRLGLRDPVADGTKCGPYGGKKSKTKSCRRSRCNVAAKSLNEERLSRPSVAGGERLGGPDTWHGEANACMRGLRRFTRNRRVPWLLLGSETCTDPQGGDPSGCRLMEGSGTKSVDGCT